VTPLGGGIAVVTGVLAGAVAGGVQHTSISWMAPFLGGLVLVTVVGLVDDRRGMGPVVKLTAQIVAALALISASGAPPVLGGWSIPLAVVWIVGLMNACNFLDNMDGILAGIAGLCALGFWGLAAGTDPGSAALGAAVAGGACGFLLYNFAPASIFMGDAGSMAFGYLLSALSLALVPAERSPAAWAGLVAIVLVVAYPIFDITFVTITRLRGRRKIYLGGRDHSSHRLNRVLENPRRTAFAIYCVTALITGLGVSLGREPSLPRMLVLGGAAAVMLTVLGLRLARLPAR
jgi:UDP-GlcNAc:undecaprenyl-phosphate GlcNAc-1-phosphate transferase